MYITLIAIAHASIETKKKHVYGRQQVCVRRKCVTGEILWELFVSVAEVDAVLKRNQSSTSRSPDGAIRLHQVGTLLRGTAPAAAQTLVRRRDV
jgi:hypothetical protein